MHATSSQGGVKLPTGGKLAERPEARERPGRGSSLSWCQQTRRNSGADGIVRMEENKWIDSRRP